MVAAQDLYKKQLTRRLMLIGSLKALALSGLAARMGYLQFIKADEYATLSEENRVKLQIIPPVRGMIQDRTGKALAENRTNYRLFLERDHRDQAIKSLDTLCDILQIDDKRKKELLLQITHSGRRVPLMIAENMTWDDVVKTEFHTVRLPGVYLEEGQLRHYPLYESAAHLIGYVGRVSESEEKDEQGLYRLPEFKIGKNGIELRFEDMLRGKPGSRRVEVNATGLSVRELAKQPFEAGKALPLTIDLELQEFAAKRMGEESGSIIVMDAHYGEVLACVSMPGFDPNQFSMGITSRYWKELMENERNPLLNKALSGIYPPASTFKMVVGLAGLKAGIINESTHYFCPGHYTLGNRRFNCWRPGGHGTINLANAIAESCDTFFYNVGERVGIENIVAMSYQMGLGEASGLGLAGERTGLLPSDAWKRKTQNVPWMKGDTINASIGQGFMLVTPIQLAIMTARMSTGKQVKPTLTKQVDAEPFALLDVDSSHIKLVLDGMNRVNNATNGTAYYHRILDETMRMGGKTGTAQVKRIITRGLDQSKLPWKHRHHGLFVGFAPVDNPRFVTSVVIEHGGGGSSAAAPVAKDVLEKVQQLAKQNPYRYKG